jgi:transposase-like protein
MNPNEKPTPDRKYKRYDEAFKRQAVEHWMLSGKSARVVAAELGINVQSLNQWKQQFKALPAGQVANTLEALQAENRRLQKELRRVAQQRDILKKTLGIISEPSEGGLNG